MVRRTTVFDWETSSSANIDIVDVGRLKDVSISENAIGSLEMEKKSKDTIKAIAKTYTDTEGQSGRFIADFIQGKGEGQIILLHGPPGTGKTLTAGMWLLLL